MFRTADGAILLPSDAAGPRPGGASSYDVVDGTNIWLSRDDGKTWTTPGAPSPASTPGSSELKDGRLMALGRGDDIEGRMPKSLSSDMGKTWSSAPARSRRSPRGSGTPCCA